jgi:hypothetical protein
MRSVVGASSLSHFIKSGSIRTFFICGAGVRWVNGALAASALIHQSVDIKFILIAVQSEDDTPRTALER